MQKSQVATGNRAEHFIGYCDGPQRGRNPNLPAHESIHHGLGVLQDDDKPLPVERDPDIGSCFCGSFPGLLYRTHKSSTGVARGIENVVTVSMN